VRNLIILSFRTSWDLSLRTSFVKQSKLVESQERLKWQDHGFSWRSGIGQKFVNRWTSCRHTS